MRTQFLTSTLAALALSGSANALLNIDFGNVLGGLGGLLGGMLDLNLLQNGQLITLGLNADLITDAECNQGDSTVLVSVQVPGLLGACACVNNDLLGTILGVTRNACDAEGACPAGSIAACVQGICTCVCPDGTFATKNGQCVPDDNCKTPNVIEADGNGVFKCTCAASYVSDGAGGCRCPTGQTAGTDGVCRGATPSSRARARSRRASHDRIANRQHVARAPAPAQVALGSMERIVRKSEKPACPAGETACPLSAGGFECIDTTSSLTSCGGCVGAGSEGVNCLAIPGALNVECHDSKCQVASCFKGWRFDGEKCV